ncbi:MAG TPA: tRNA (guanosine(37)-N1)-methyltransferase TrmD [Dehalococcoidia bacterium]|jgi:tRNA (guanine37-N1)-methyltransferase|nr:tRNA (guanosine(37)-N1)-methyltransferase TrmD [Dehalococcoidia bacterium]|tara:strand:- start:127 stop:870 length:744 start_codon:yes stop_codon:yes gene_type:complete
MLKIDVLSTFPEIFQSTLHVGIVGRALDKKLAEVITHDLRDYAVGNHKSTDDSPFGGGPGMVMRPEPIYAALNSLGLQPGTPVIALSAQGKLFNQREAERLAQNDRVVLLCGRYEGIDERVLQNYITEEISVGDYVVSGGEIPAMLLIDSLIRLLPGALGHGENAISDDSHTSGILQFPQYTRPAVFQGLKVPDILLSGDHNAIAQWRRNEALKRTLERRPELLDSASLDENDKKNLGAIYKEKGII